MLLTVLIIFLRFETFSNKNTKNGTNENALASWIAMNSATTNGINKDTGNSS